MLCYDTINVSEVIDVIKTSELKEHNICHYWHFLDKGYKFQPYACNGCHDVLTIYMNLSDNAILNNRGVDYHCIISRISDSEAINLLQKTDLKEKLGTL